MNGAFPAREAGYTIVELLVVLLLLSFITLAVSSGLRFGTRVWETTDTTVVEARHVVALQTVLRSLLISAVPKSKGDYVDFEGTSSEMRFEAPAPRAVDVGGLVLIEVTVERRSGDVVISMKPATGVAQTARFTAPVLGLSIDYLDASDTKPVWLSRWHDRKRLPDAVRISGDRPEARATWPLFVTRLPINQAPLCAFDPVSLECRSS
jgi:type II secretory pathway pseudopilin PulG